MTQSQANIDKLQVRRHFDRHAQQYDQYAVVQRWMGERLLEKIADWAAGRTVLRIAEVGCGTGWLTERLLRLFPHAQLTAIDLSERMIEQTQLKLGNRISQVNFIVGDAEEWGKDAAGEEFDLIVSNATFQWFNAPERTCRALSRQLRGGGMLAFATFGPQTFVELHTSFAAAEQRLGLPHLPHGQTFLAEQEWRRIFGYHQSFFSWEQAIHRMVYPDVAAFLHSVRKIGAANANRTDRPTMTRSLYEGMREHYEREFTAGHAGIQVTYEVGIVQYIAGL